MPSIQAHTPHTLVEKEIACTLILPTVLGTEWANSTGTAVSIHVHEVQSTGGLHIVTDNKLHAVAVSYDSWVTDTRQYVRDGAHSRSDGQTHLQDTSDGPDVNLVAVTLLPKNLRSNVVWSATQCAGVCVCR